MTRGIFYQNSFLFRFSQEEVDSFVCPQHVCHTCASDDPRAAISRCSGDKIVKCLSCPASYHSTNLCVPAGADIITSTQIVCPRHRNKSKYYITKLIIYILMNRKTSFYFLFKKINRCFFPIRIASYLYFSTYCINNCSIIIIYRRQKSDHQYHMVFHLQRGR